MKFSPNLYTLILLLLVSCGCKGQEDSVCRASQGSEECSASDEQPAARGDVRTGPVCFVVRTYWGHGDDHGGELRQFLRSLQAQRVKRFVFKEFVYTVHDLDIRQDVLPT